MMTQKMMKENKALNLEIYNKVKNTQLTQDNYYSLLGDIQNSPRHEYHDIMTFSAFMTTWEQKVEYFNMQLESMK